MKHFEKKLPDAELEIMKVIWNSVIPISTSEVKSIIDKNGNSSWTLSTLQTLLNRLIAKSFLEKGKRGKEYIYTPLIDEKEYVEFESELFLKKMHGNSLTSFVSALFDSKKISEQDISALEKLFKDKKR